MNRVGMMVDVSHISKAAMLEAIKVSKAPVIGSHSSTTSAQISSFTGGPQTGIVKTVQRPLRLPSFSITQAQGYPLQLQPWISTPAISGNWPCRWPQYSIQPWSSWEAASVKTRTFCRESALWFKVSSLM